MTQSLAFQGFVGTSTSSIRPDNKASEAELTLVQPSKPRLLLRLQQWLYGTTKARTVRIAKSGTGDMIQKVAFERPVPLLRMLTALPYIAEVTAQQPCAGSKSMLGPGQRINQFRVLLRDACDSAATGAAGS